MGLIYVVVRILSDNHSLDRRQRSVARPRVYILAGREDFLAGSDLFSEELLERQKRWLDEIVFQNSQPL